MKRVLVVQYVKEDELLAEQSVFGNVVSLGMCKIDIGTEHNRMLGRLSEMQESLFKKGDEMAGQLG